MAVRANHIALRDLIKDRSPAAPADASGDIKFLLAEVIELEDDRDRSRRSRRMDVHGSSQ
jgi:hypothetical protein